jgi:hypothetical protein
MKLTPEAKTFIAEAFESVGGVAALVKWVKSSQHNRTEFYSKIYPLLIPLQVTGQHDVTINNESQTQATLEQLLGGLIDARERDQEILTIEHRADESAPSKVPSDQVPRADREATADAAPVVQHRMLTSDAAAEPLARPRSAPKPEPPDLPPRPKELAAEPRTSAAPQPSAVPPRPPGSPGIYTGLAIANGLPISADRELNATEKFILWSGNQSGWRI